MLAATAVRIAPALADPLRSGEPPLAAITQTCPKCGGPLTRASGDASKLIASPAASVSACGPKTMPRAYACRPAAAEE